MSFNLVFSVRNVTFVLNVLEFSCCRNLEPEQERAQVLHARNDVGVDDDARQEGVALEHVDAARSAQEQEFDRGKLAKQE